MVKLSDSKTEATKYVYTIICDLKKIITRDKAKKVHLLKYFYKFKNGSNNNKNLTLIYIECHL